MFATRFDADILWDFSGSEASRVPFGESAVRVNELVRKSIVFLGILDARGEFAPYGTAFIVGWPADEPQLFHHYLVTAKHVVDDMIATKRPLVCRVNAKDGTAKLGAIESEHWFTHPQDRNCDIAVAGFICSFDTFDWRSTALPTGVLTKEYIEKNYVGCGDEVFTAGLLVSHFGRNKNVPIIRTGTIAAMPDDPVDLGTKLGVQEVYLIESRSIGGLSGSPVFLHTPPFRIIDDKVASMDGHQTEYIMGVNIGLFETSAHSDKLRTEEADRREHFLEAMSAGIAVVVPIQKAIDIIRDTPDLQKGREMSLKMFRGKHPFVPTSVVAPIGPSAESEGSSSSPSPANDANPTHRARRAQ